jgi:hypothetical protein
LDEACARPLSYDFYHVPSSNHRNGPMGGFR